jgi:hypothetical protein
MSASYPGSGRPYRPLPHAVLAVEREDLCQLRESSLPQTVWHGRSRQDMLNAQTDTAVAVVPKPQIVTTDDVTGLSVWVACAGNWHELGQRSPSAGRAGHHRVRETIW